MATHANDHHHCYFENRQRIANVVMEPASNRSPSPNARKVVVSQDEYLNLKRIAQQYENLRQNLRLGGVTEETLDVLSATSELISDNTKTSLGHESPRNGQPDDWQVASTGYTSPSWQDTYENRSTGNQSDSRYTHERANGFSRSPSGASTSSGYGYKHSHTDRRSRNASNWNETLDVNSDMDDDGYMSNGQIEVIPRNTLQSSCDRSVQLCGITDSTTYADIIASISGGPLLHVYIRAADRSAIVSFVYGTDAKAFFDHVRRHDLYIKNKRVDIYWCERQFVLPGHVAGRIRSGATRNLVIRQCDPLITEQKVRDDLEHIYNLVVVKVEFINGDCRISTNSVHNALNARTCMMSRPPPYKGHRFEWFDDECARPIESPVPTIKPKRQTVKKPAATVANRFQFLDMDDGDGEDTE